MHEKTDKPHEKDLNEKYPKDQDGKTNDKTCHDIITCDKHIDREIKTALPVSIRPAVIPQKPHVKCLGDIKIQPGIKQCKSPQKVFDFTVTQNISVKIPIKYRTEVCYGEECFEAVDEI